MSDLNELRRVLEAYTPTTPGQAAERARFLDFVAVHPDCCERRLAVGHITGSALVLSSDGQRTLLTHHRKLGLWLQPGGHADGDTDLARVALREAEEETGLHGLRVEPAVFDLDRHWIPERKGETGHWHYDLRFLVHAGADETFQVSAESHALAWRPLSTVASDPAMDASLRRMARQWLARAEFGGSNSAVPDSGNGQ
ncbi:MAG: NUDIX hydrolase [Lysobacterales bacterium]